jgi:hypothetical protein
VEGRKEMATGLFNWSDVVADLAEVAAFAALIMLVFRVHRNIVALLRVVRRLDRKTPDPSTIGYRAQAEINEGRAYQTEETAP